MAIGKPCENTLYFGFSCSYLKNQLGDPNFFIAQKWLAGQDENICKV